MMRNDNRTLSDGRKAALFLAPILLLCLVFAYYPFLKTVVNSLSVVNSKGELLGFAGLENFRYVFARRDFQKAVANTLLLTALHVPSHLLVTLTLALLAEKKRRLSPVYETMFTLPMAVSMSAACMIFKAMFSPSLGWVNHFFGWKIGWFEDSATAMLSLVLLTVWMGVGFDFLLLRAALRNVPATVLDAARLDGSGYFSTLLRVKLPLISPTILYVVCTNGVLALLCSGPILLITQGGPARSTTTLIYMMYASGFGSSDYSLAAVVCLVTFALSLVFTILAFTLEKRKVFYQ